MARVGQVGKAIYDFPGNPDNHELSLRIGDVVLLEDLEIGKGWWKVAQTLTSESGLVPTWSIELLPDTVAEVLAKQTLAKQSTPPPRPPQPIIPERPKLPPRPTTQPRPSELPIDSLFRKDSLGSETPTNENPSTLTLSIPSSTTLATPSTPAQQPAFVDKLTKGIRQIGVDSGVLLRDSFSSSSLDTGNLLSNDGPGSFEDACFVENSESRTLSGQETPNETNTSVLTRRASGSFLPDSQHVITDDARHSQSTSNFSSVNKPSFYQSFKRQFSVKRGTQSTEQYADLENDSRLRGAPKSKPSSESQNDTTAPAPAANSSSSRLTRSFRQKLGHRRVRSDAGIINDIAKSDQAERLDKTNIQNSTSSLSTFKRSSSLRGSIKYVLRTHPATQWITAKRASNSMRWDTSEKDHSVFVCDNVSHVSRPPFASVAVEQSQVVNRAIWKRPLIEYQITIDGERQVTRHVRQFAWLQEQLEKQFGQIMAVPRLGELSSTVGEVVWDGASFGDGKASLSTAETNGYAEPLPTKEELRDLDQQRLHTWLSKIANHPIFSNTRAVYIFLQYEDSADANAWKTGKRLVEKISSQSQSSKKLGYKYKFLDELDRKFYLNQAKASSEFLLDSDDSGSDDDFVELSKRGKVLPKIKISMPSTEYIESLRTSFGKLLQCQEDHAEHARYLGKVYEKQVSPLYEKLAASLGTMTHNLVSIVQNQSCTEERQRNESTSSSTAETMTSVAFQLTQIAGLFSSNNIELAKAMGKDGFQESVAKEVMRMENLQKFYLDVIDDAIEVKHNNFHALPGSKSHQNSWDDTSRVEERANFLISFLCYDIHYITRSKLLRLREMYKDFLLIARRYHERQLAKISEIMSSL